MGETSELSFIELESNIELTTVRGWISYSATPDRRDWRKSGLREYVCPDEVNKDIDDLAVYLNTTYYPIDVVTEVRILLYFIDSNAFCDSNVIRNVLYDRLNLPHHHNMLCNWLLIDTTLILL